MKKTYASVDHGSIMIKEIEKMPNPNGGRGGREAFAFFIQCALGAVCEANYHNGSQMFLTNSDHRALGFVAIDPDLPEATYAEVGRAVHAYLEAVRASEPFTDLISPVFAHFVGRTGKGLGQFFTPSTLALSCAMLLDVAAGPLRLSDPCCGAGGLLLAYLQIQVRALTKTNDCRTLGLSMEVHAGDIDPLCAAMSALQLTASQLIHGITLGRVTVEKGDSLTNEGSPVFRSISRYTHANSDAAPVQAILTNPPFGDAAGRAWERARAAA
jgi:hypothetical protein